jgi:tetratricopeptide (TPR) repeat protein
MSLWASGADINGGIRVNNKNSTYGAVISAAIAELQNAPDLPASLTERGEYVLTFLYQKFLKRYSLRQTEVDAIFRTGYYNCVSSAALYLIFGSAVDLEIQGVLTRDHAFVSVQTEKGPIDVETTNRYGFDPGNRKEFHDNFGKATGFAYVPAKNYRDRSPLSKLELISVIFSNRISDMQSRGRYDEALGLALNRAAMLSLRKNPADSPYFLDPERDVLDRLIFYASNLLKTGKEDDVFRWIELTSGKFPPGEYDEQLRELEFAAVNNLILKHVRAENYAEARAALDREAFRIDADSAAKLGLMILDAELTGKTQKIRTITDAEAVLAEIDISERAGNGLPAERVTELRNFALVKKSELISKAQGWPAAIAFLETGIARYGNNPLLERNLQVFRSNYVTDFHNAFARAYNRHNYIEAIEIVEEALKEFPGNRQLTADLATAKKAAAK